jgi:hypothetical protein
METIATAAGAHKLRKKKNNEINIAQKHVPSRH